jgi:hypothetical protein
LYNQSFFAPHRFFEAGNLRKHLLRHTDPDRFKCDICQKRVVDARTLFLHRKTHESDGRRPFPCDECGRAYKLQKTLNSHIRTAHSEFIFIGELFQTDLKISAVQQLATCRICPFSGNKENVRRHESRVHQIKRPRKCVFDD